MIATFQKNTHLYALYGKSLGDNDTIISERR